MDTGLDVRKEFSALPEEWQRSYELKLTNFVKTGQVKESDLLQTVRGYANKIAAKKSENADDKVAYAAFYCLNILFRLHYDTDKLSRLMEENRSWCRSHISFTHLETLWYLQFPEAFGLDEDCCLVNSYTLATRYPDNAGYSNAFTQLYATICEKERDEKRMELEKQWGQKAHRCIENAIRLDVTYAKYYCNLGRLLALDGEYEKADAAIQKAMGLEDSNRSDYAIRIGSYQYYRLQVQAKKQINATGVQKQLDELKGAVTSNIEILTFFAGIVSFVIGGLTLASGQTAFQAAMLIVVLMGSLLFVFSLFHLLLHLRTGRGRWWNIAVAIVGALIVTGGILFVR